MPWRILEPALSLHRRLETKRLAALVVWFPPQDLLKGVREVQIQQFE